MNAPGESGLAPPMPIDMNVHKIKPKNRKIYRTGHIVSMPIRIVADRLGCQGVGVMTVW